MRVHCCVCTINTMHRSIYRGLKMNKHGYITRNIRMPVGADETLDMLAKKLGVSKTRVITVFTVIEMPMLEKLVKRYLPVADERYPLGKPGRRSLSDTDRAFLAMDEKEKKELLSGKKKSS